MSKQATLERRRAARLSAEREQAALALRSRRLRRLAAVTAAAATLVVIAALVSSAGGRDAPPPSEPSTLFAGLSERGGVLGDPDAPLTVTEYVDLQCPACAAAAQSTLPALIRDHVRTSEVKLAVRTLHFLGPDSVRAARVAAAAERQGRLWPFLDAFYARGAEGTGYVTDELLREAARAAGADAGAALDEAGSAFAAGRLERANADAARMGIESTPTLTVRRGDGPERVLDADALDPASVSAALGREAGR